MKYLLEKQETVIKPTAVYCRTAQAVIHSFRWKQIALSDDLGALKQICGNRHRIINRDTGEEIFRTAPAGLW